MTVRTWIAWQPGEQPVVHVVNETGHVIAPVSSGNARLMVETLLAFLGSELERLMKDQGR